MAIRDFKDLVCWQLAHTLKCEVYAFTADGPAARDFKYRDQIRDSASGAPRCIAEGFGRFRPREFARFLEYARASLMETRNSLIDGLDSGYIAEPLYSRLMNLAGAALRTTTALMRQKQQQAEDERARRKPGNRSAPPLGSKPESYASVVKPDELKPRKRSPT
jgi:four helix bundle protein